MSRLTKKQKYLMAVAAVMVGCVMLIYARPLAGALFSDGPEEGGRKELTALLSRLQTLEKQRQRRQMQLQELRAYCQSVLWEGQGKVLSTVLQAELNAIARKERMSLRSVGSPQTQEIGQGVREVELSVRLQGDMSEIGRFLARVDAANPRFFWTTCTLRTINRRDPDIVDLSGRIKAVFATGEVQELVFGEDSQ